MLHPILQCTNIRSNAVCQLTRASHDLKSFVAFIRVKKFVLENRILKIDHEIKNVKKLPNNILKRIIISKHRLKVVSVYPISA